MNQKPIVLQVLPSLQIGGVERCVIETAKAMVDSGIENYVVSNGGALVRELEQLGVQHIQLPVHSKNPFIMMRTIQALSNVVQEKKITLIHVGSRAPAWVVRSVSQKTGVPFITTFHGTYGTKPRCFKIPYNSVMLKGKKVVAVSDFIKQHILDNYAISPNQIITVHDGIDISRFNPEKVSDDRVQKLRDLYHIPADKKIIVLPARRTWWKGHQVLLEAVAQMKNKNLFVLFVGSDQGRVDYTEKLNEQIKTLPPSIKVCMVDSCPDMPALYKLGDVIACVSILPEAFGLTVIEAQAMGQIVVAAAHGGALETINDKKNGFLVPANDPRALADTLDRILSLSEKDTQKIRQEAIKSVCQNFSVAQMGRKMIELYREFSK